MNRIRTFLIAVVLGSLGRNLDTLIDFLNRLDDRIDAYVAEQKARSARLDDTIASLRTKQDALANNAAIAESLRRRTV